MKKATGKEIRDAVERWARFLDLGNWQIVVRIGKISGGHRGTCECDNDYREAVLRFDPTAMQKHGDEVNEIVLHELWHVITWRTHQEVQRLAKNGLAEAKLCAVEEAETTHASRAFLKLAKEGRLL